MDGELSAGAQKPASSHMRKLLWFEGGFERKQKQLLKKMSSARR